MGLLYSQPYAPYNKTSFKYLIISNSEFILSQAQGKRRLRTGDQFRPWVVVRPHYDGR